MKLYINIYYYINIRILKIEINNTIINNTIINITLLTILLKYTYFKN